MKKTLITTLTLAAIAAAPALAQTNQTSTRAHAAQARAVGSADGYGLYSYDPYLAVVGNHVVGRDPDPAIRLQLKRDVPSDN